VHPPSANFNKNISKHIKIIRKMVRVGGSPQWAYFGLLFGVPFDFSSPRNKTSDNEQNIKTPSEEKQSQNA
jgi:hypothetical protein